MWTFRAMNTEVAVCAPQLDDAAQRRFADETAKLFAAVESRFSRFVPDSELSRLNRATTSVVVSPEMIELLRDCERHVADTCGIFDPTIGAALSAAGYDRSFAPGVLDRDHGAVAPPTTYFGQLQIDDSARIVRRPPHLMLDFGGFLKGRTADHALAAMPHTALVDAGGDIAVRGDGPDGDGWLVEIEDPERPQRGLATLRLHDRAVATSAPNRRRWRTGSSEAHHLIDPRTGLPSCSDLLQVSVVAPTAEQADVYAKTAFLVGSRDGQRFIAERRAAGIAAILVERDSTLEIVGDLELLRA